MKFKRQISLLLAFFLLVSNMGFAFNVHYCGDDVSSVSLKTAFLSQNSEDNCCGIVKKKSHCCNDKVVHFQKKADHLILKSFSFNPDFTFLIEEWNPIAFFAIKNFKNSQTTTYYCDANAPPFFKLYRQYIFYA
jgi:hypothetical protein